MERLQELLGERELEAMNGLVAPQTCSYSRIEAFDMYSLIERNKHLGTRQTGLTSSEH